MNAHRPRRGVSLVAALVLSSFAVVLVLSPGAAADKYVSGTIPADTTWGLPEDDTYVLTADVVVPPGLTLTILPGTSVLFDAGVTLHVDGALYADGDSSLPIDFGANDSAALIPPRGIEFRPGSVGSVSFSTFDRFYTPVIANQSSPYIASNTVNAALIGFALEQSSSMVWDNVVQRAAIGVYVNASNAWIAGNSLNGTEVGIEILTSGSPTVVGNAITNVISAFAVGIRVGAGTSPVIQGNWISRVRGTNGGTLLSPGANGTNGGFAFGIFVDSASDILIEWNSIDTVLGGNGGNGTANASGTGGRGGDGGPAVGIVAFDTTSVDLISNTVTNVLGGRGGRGGEGPTTLDGGDGGDGGDAAASFVVSVSSVANVLSNVVDGITGGRGGTGGSAEAGTDGDGGDGGSAFALAVGSAADADLSGNTISNILGGPAGNGTAGIAWGVGGRGGDALGLMAFPVGGFTLFHFNDVSVVTGGGGGTGVEGGAGGNATGVFGFGPDDINFNQTSMTSNRIEFVSGGNGGPGTTGGGDGGLAAGISVVRVRVDSSSNILEVFQGGGGGNAGAGFVGGVGGEAAGFAAYLVPQAVSTRDTISGVTRGSAGVPTPVQATYGRGYYAAGNATIATTLSVENGTVSAVGDFDLAIDNYADATTIATPLDETKISIMPAGNLTVMNYLRVDVFWPDGATPVAGASIRVEDNGLPIWDASSPTGSQSWILAADRVYINSNTATDNVTDVSVSYPSYAFLNNPRSVDLSAAATESFVMIDSDAPTSTAGPLSRYTTTAIFSVPYAASDGAGVGLRNITLWYRQDGGPWTRGGTQAAANSGSFSFTSSGDGVYEFATVANDTAGNEEPFPGSNDTWTIVDTTRPGSLVTALSTYQTSASFVVSWGPDPGVTDIATYRIQYNRGFGWTDWLVGTTATSQTFTADPAWGLYQFRSIATDRAGNVEPIPSGNDTWTTVDTEPPESRVAPLSLYQTALTFTVSWGPVEDSFDIDTYRIDVNDNGGGWTVWIPATDGTSADFTGTDGHRYEFRSIATDRAGNVEPIPSGNDTWTTVDVTPPDSLVTPLATYTRSLTIALTWGPAAGTTDIATYTIEVSDNGGTWTAVPAYVGTIAMSGSFTGVEGHRYAFRSISRDVAGNVEPAPTGNDTWTLIDTRAPSVTFGSPQGSGANATPTVTVTFSEAMDRASVEQAFFISPSATGQFTWSADSHVLTFVPDGLLAAGRDYVVSIGPGAQDLAGNSLAFPYSFTFTTAAAPPAGSSLADLWWIFLAVGAAVVAAFLLVMRRRQTAASSALKVTAAPVESEAIIEDVFLLYHRDGILIKHETRRLRPEVDSDVLSGMLTAVQQFVKDALRGDDYAELSEMRVGHMHILIGRGKWIVLAARIEGDGSASWTQQIERCIKDMEDHQWDQLEDWDGDMTLSRDLSPYVKKLIHGDYA